MHFGRLTYSEFASNAGDAAQNGTASATGSIGTPAAKEIKRIRQRISGLPSSGQQSFLNIFCRSLVNCREASPYWIYVRVAVSGDFVVQTALDLTDEQDLYENRILRGT